jgi:hypothetical protein
MNVAKQGFLSLLFLFLAVSLILSAQMASAQSKPSAPQFTAKFVGLSYDTPTVYGTDPYTGNQVVTYQGYRIDNRSIEFTIKNQPFTAPTTPSGDGNISGLFFNFRMKGHYGTEWSDYYPFAPDGQTTSVYGGIFPYSSEVAPAPAFIQSDGEYTTVTITIPGVWRVPEGAPLDVEVQAIVGYMYYSDKLYHFVGQYGDWSDPQTVVVTGPRTANDPALPYPEQFPVSPQNSSETPPYVYTPWNATSTPIQPAQTGVSLDPDWMPIAVAALVVAVIVPAATVVLQRRSGNRKREHEPNA